MRGDHIDGNYYANKENHRLAMNVLEIAKMNESKKERLVREGVLKKTIIIVDAKTKKIHYEPMRTLSKKAAD